MANPALPTNYSPISTLWNGYSTNGSQAFDNNNNAISIGQFNQSANQGQYGKALSDLVSNPSSVASNPLFQSSNAMGLDAVRRQLAANGNGNSGNALAAISDYQSGQNNKNFFNLADLYSTLNNSAKGLNNQSDQIGIQQQGANLQNNMFQYKKQQDQSYDQGIGAAYSNPLQNPYTNNSVSGSSDAWAKTLGSL